MQRIDLSKARLRAVDEAPYRAFVAAGGELVMLSTAIYPALLAAPGRLRPGDRHRRAARPARLRGASRSPTRWKRSRCEDFGGPAKAGVAAARAGTDLLLFTDLAGAEAARRALVAKLRAGALDRARVRGRRPSACSTCARRLARRLAG